MADRSSKTEQPTPRRLERARKEGQYPSAREFVSALQFMVFLALLGIGGGQWFQNLRSTVRSLLTLAFAGEVQAETLSHLAWQLFWRNFLPLVLGGAAVALATLALRLITTRF